MEEKQKVKAYLNIRLTRELQEQWGKYLEENQLNGSHVLRELMKRQIADKEVDAELKKKKKRKPNQSQRRAV